jgi:hypothetical protein
MVIVTVTWPVPESVTCTVPTEPETPKLFAVRSKLTELADANGAAAISKHNTVRASTENFKARSMVKKFLRATQMHAPFQSLAGKLWEKCYLISFRIRGLHLSLRVADRM